MEIIKNYLWTEESNQLDNAKLFEACMDIEQLLRKQFGGPPVGEKDDRLFTTSIFSKYNIFTYPNAEIQKLYKLLTERFSKYLDADRTYMLQSWLNVYRKGAFIGLHGHWPSEANVWHGYYCVNTEGSVTSYVVDKETYEVKNKDGLIVIGRSGEDKHQSSPWNEEKARITIAFDIVPIDSITQRKLNHYLPV